ncbi:N-acetylmuramoyl-L-alanine amidase [Lederbergia galactosidilytica]|uniref:SH3b domain-containing protein n=1 Tax=Lederbergia galactosidilytica TaxID=217031 RepID=A0A178A2Y8_9BACI|nr:N-acetylmuramoyl-L-alanine amidase [Lederbergia galactosidilytica]KRG13290.1 hypothetical protein ACA30_15410 [Virgibacillus soli]MBP1914888.1 N-acetylmuramoyl-L-alanine amidase [Lederbergia galactosidilytica]OAK74179.1 hypothetical protein ABB05_04625 [Lederbergia galactosidilytica]
MKKKAIVLTITVLFIAIIMYFSPISSANSEKIMITGDLVNVREQPGTAYSIVTQIHKGETYSLLDSKGDWYKIKLSSNQTGWIASWLAEKQSKSKTTTGTVNTATLNVRAEPDSASTKIGVLHEGDQVKKIGEQNDWSQIEYESETAWVNSAYINTQDSNPADSVSVSNAAQGNPINILYDHTNIRKKPALKSKIVAQVSAGETFYPLEKKGDWYKIEYSSGETGYVASWIVSSQGGNKKPGAKTIVIDPGHGGRDQGATGARGTLEKTLTLEVGNLLARKLDSAGFNVVLTRSSDEYISLESRTEQARQEQADAFISLHFDSIDEKQVVGHTSYYYNEQDRALAQAIHNEITNTIKLQDREARFGNYYVLRENSQPSVLLELGYLSNPQEENIIQSSSYQEQVTKAIVKGLNNYFSE